MARERLERTVRIEADIRTSGDQRLEVRGVGTEIYRDAKGSVKRSARTFSTAMQWLGTAIPWLLVRVAVVMAPLILLSQLLNMWLNKASFDWGGALAVSILFVLPGVIVFVVKWMIRNHSVWK